MPKPKEETLTYEMIITGIMKNVSGPLPVQELVTQMLTALPSFARNPRQAMRSHIRHENGRQLVFLDADTVLPLHLAYQGVRFRIALERESFNKGLLPLDKSLWSYLPSYFNLDRLQLVDASGHTILTQIERETKQVQSLFGIGDETETFANLRAWYRSQKMYVKDHLLVTILDWERGVLQLEREPFGRRNLALLAERNRLLADMFYGQLESASREHIYIQVAVPTAYARLPDKGGYPPGHWRDVLDADGRMESSAWMIYYRDSDGSPFDRLLLGDRQESEAVPAPSLSKEKREQVYRFKASLVYRLKTWREIEIQGGQTLADLDMALRDAFNYDFMDHMGGFWKLIPRAAQTKTISKRSSKRQARYREVELGTVEPMGGGEGAKIKVAGLGLTVGAQVKYVYDFGDWIEHSLTLQAIEAPQSGAKYPCEVNRNAPEYAFCVECQKKGKQTIAQWICLQCSAETGQEILLCEKCSGKHEDHYLEKIIY